MLWMKFGKNRFHGLEEMSFENFDDGRTTDTWLYYKLRWAKNTNTKAGVSPDMTKVKSMRSELVYMT